MTTMFRKVGRFGGIALLVVNLLASCSQQNHVAVTPVVGERSPYEKFVHRTKKYPTVMQVYLDDALLNQATPKSPIVICLRQQRGRLYVDGKVAADWPVSTGADTHPTPTGRYKVRLKKKEHASNRYGKMYNEKGKCINDNADAFTEQIPEGGRFVGSSMPNWMRLTSDGVGMHTGRVVAGKRLSHGCIRLPHVVACMLFDIVDLGTPVSILEDIEPNYPVAEILAQREIEAAESASMAEPEELPEDAR
ncbi:MAG: L,D-transpeptidase [Akkermansia sp.]|nr:L,D-transpeptidase [Akkermansia sp.]MBR2313521.1 L,D-transpeptidase [Akkermansia sp.]